MIPVFVINLARSSDRRAATTRALAAQGIVPEFVTAVDGAGLDMSPELAITQPHIESGSIRERVDIWNSGD